jgi:hypothetical protein
LACFRLRRSVEVASAGPLGERSLDLYCEAIEVDVTAAQCGQLAPSQAAEHGEKDQRTIARVDGVGELADLADGEHRSFG